jgi:hypothetical protein
VQPRPPDLCRTQAFRHREVVRTALMRIACKRNRRPRGVHRSDAKFGDFAP